MKKKLLSLFLLLGIKDTFSQNIVNINSILINGKISITTSKKALEIYYGKNYIKEKFQPECGYFDQEVFYKVKFSLFKKNGIDFIVYNKIAEFDEIDLTKNNNNFVQIGKIKIRNNTTLENLKKYFSKSYKVYKIEKKKNKKYNIFELKYDNISVDSLIIELDNKNKVKSCKCFSPC